MQAMRTGGWTARFTLEAATASGDDVGSTRPIASRMGNPNITPAPRKKVRRGIKLFCIIRHLLFWVETVLEWETRGDLFHHERRPVVVPLKRFHGPIDHAFVEPI